MKIKWNVQHLYQGKKYKLSLFFVVAVSVTTTTIIRQLWSYAYLDQGMKEYKN